MIGRGLQQRFRCGFSVFYTEKLRFGPTDAGGALRGLLFDGVELERGEKPAFLSVLGLIGDSAAGFEPVFAGNSVLEGLFGVLQLL